MLSNQHKNTNDKMKTTQSLDKVIKNVNVNAIVPFVAHNNHLDLIHAVNVENAEIVHGCINHLESLYIFGKIKNDLRNNMHLANLHGDVYWLHLYCYYLTFSDKKKNKYEIKFDYDLKVTFDILKNKGCTKEQLFDNIFQPMVDYNNSIKPRGELNFNNIYRENLK